MPFCLYIGHPQLEQRWLSIAAIAMRSDDLALSCEPRCGGATVKTSNGHVRVSHSGWLGLLLELELAL